MANVLLAPNVTITKGVDNTTIWFGTALNANHTYFEYYIIANTDTILTVAFEKSSGSLLSISLPNEIVSNLFPSYTTIFMPPMICIDYNSHSSQYKQFEVSSKANKVQ